MAALWGVLPPTGKNETVVLPVVAACARIRNEARYLKEWVEFHRLVGVRYFYIFDDESRDETRSVLAPYEASGEAFVWPMSSSCGRSHEVCADRTHDAEHGEFGFRDECLRANPAGADWIVMTDVDEFLYPSHGSLPEHLARCDPRLAYVLVRWHVFGAAGHVRRPSAPTIESYRERGVEDDSGGCYPRLTCGDDYAPPICAKVVARAACVLRQGTHYVTKVAHDCVDIYAGDRKLAAVADDERARREHERCAAPLHLNHYAVRSREDFVEKFERGRISSEARDVQRGHAESSSSGAVTRRVDARAAKDFLNADAKAIRRAVRHKKASAATTRTELMLVEFARRDHSEVLDESILRYAAPLRRAVSNANPIPPLMTWACLNQTPAQAATHHRALFLHIPKTGGTTLNLVLAEAARRERRSFCELSFADLEAPRRRRAKARSCDLLSAETDVSIAGALQGSRVALFVFLREPLSRVASQFEHHLAAGRMPGASRLDLVEVASPRLCPQLERDAQCASLAHPRKCRAGGWCTIFQNHQTHVLAGAQHFSTDANSALRRTSSNLLCAARNNLKTLAAVGLTERFDLSLCLLFHALGYSGLFHACCSSSKRRSCDLFDLRAEKHSAADRANRLAHSSSSSSSSSSSRSRRANSSSYLAKYLDDDDLLLAAIYEGNTLDCALYAEAVTLVEERAAALALSTTSIGGRPLRHHCDRGAAALAKLLPWVTTTPS
ncbi:hypothetical protein CTAYLR_003243 [Chrysophaeum taylorii]|uniref:Glycosyltransferase family 92 protein n=1 Tax=Chrysophaeum taylorii TaxID=2483200 RepID=A0AAD7UCL2_9STRA|nr:hypothetical protein CTAYLR_003243 [Chrysophaeum taylorii]